MTEPLSRVAPSQNIRVPNALQQGGIHSGFMIAHCTAAALVSENKVGTAAINAVSVALQTSMRCFGCCFGVAYLLFAGAV